MANLPYVTSPGSIKKALEKIKEAKTPDTVSIDFVQTVLGIKGGSGGNMASFLKKIGFAHSDGAPTEDYKKFRNASESKQILAKLIKQSYVPLYERNEYIHKASENEIKGHIIEITGNKPGSSPVKQTYSCFKNLIAEADFEANTDANTEVISENLMPETHKVSSNHTPSPPREPEPQQVGFNLGYTINLNLPATTDAAVFDAIFKSFRENFLRKEDA